MPNPADESVTVIFPESEGRVTVELSDLSGRVVRTVGGAGLGGRLTVDVSDLASGPYLVRLASADRQQVTRLTVR